VASAWCLVRSTGCFVLGAWRRLLRAACMAGAWLSIASIALAGQASSSTITGQVVDAASGLGLANVRVQFADVTMSAQTGQDGTFRLEAIPVGRHTLVVSVVGYVHVRREIVTGAGGSIHLVIPLVEGTGTYTEQVHVVGDLFRQAEAGVPAQQVLGSADLQNLRGLVVDDPVRALHVLPGVAATDDFTAEFSVRGSDFAHTGLAIEGVSSPFLSHTVQGADESGSVGMINSDILESVALLNGSYPQRFGNRTGAQVEMTLRDGTRDRTHARVALSGSSASIVGEGPIGRERRGSWLLSARKSYLDLLIKRVSDDNNFAFGFSDLAGKLTWDLTSTQHVQASAIVGHSKLLASQLHVGPNNPLVASSDAFLGVVTWRYARSPRVSFSQHLSVTGGRYHSRSLERVVLDEGKSLTAGWRAGFTIMPAPRWTIEGGVNAAHGHDEASSRRVVDSGAPARLRDDAALDSSGAGGYAEARWSGPRNALVAAGARVDYWTGTDAAAGSPWLRGQVPLGAGVDLVAGTGLYRQFPGFNEVAGIRGTPDLASERAWQADVGISRRIGGLMRAQATWYQRRGENGIRLPHDDWQVVDGVLRPPQFDTRYVNALAERATGIELQLQRRSPNGLSGWVSYSYGHAREHDRLTGERFDADFDQRHALNLYGLYRVSDRTALSVKLRASSNFPVQGYVEELSPTEARPIPEDAPGLYAVSTVRNGARLPGYARLDLRANRTFVFTRSRLTLFVEVMNVLGRTNWRTAPGFISPDGEIRQLLKPLVPFVPSAGMLVEF
jgi:hypothetical protein